MLDLVSDPLAADPRRRAMRALARLDPETFLATLSGLDPDRDWTVRAAPGGGAGHAARRAGAAAADGDAARIATSASFLRSSPRWWPSKAPEAEQILLERLKADDFVVRAAAANGLGELKVDCGACRRCSRPIAPPWRQHLYGAGGGAGRAQPASIRPRPGRCCRRR